MNLYTTKSRGVLQLSLGVVQNTRLFFLGGASDVVTVGPTASRVLRLARVVDMSDSLITKWGSNNDLI